MHAVMAAAQAGELDLSAKAMRAFEEEVENNAGSLLSIFCAQHISWALVGHTAAAMEDLLQCNVSDDAINNIINTDKFITVSHITDPWVGL